MGEIKLTEIKHILSHISNGRRKKATSMQFLCEWADRNNIHMAFEDELSDKILQKIKKISDRGQHINRCIDSTNGKIKDTRVSWTKPHPVSRLFNPSTKRSDR